MIHNISDAEFQEKLQNETLPIIIDFWAEWCAPCKTMGEALVTLEQEHEGKAFVAKINIDEHGETATAYGVRSIPTIICFKNGEEVSRIVGADLTKLAKLFA